MTGVKVASVTWVLAIAGSATGSVAQVIVGPETLLPLGVAVGCLVLAVGAAFRVARWVDRVEHRGENLKKDVDRINKKLDKLNNGGEWEE